MCVRTRASPSDIDDFGVFVANPADLLTPASSTTARDAVPFLPPHSGASARRRQKRSAMSDVHPYDAQHQSEVEELARAYLDAYAAPAATARR